MEQEDLLANLPSEIMIEILSRLPVSTIMTCKRVCRSWFDLISSNEFVNFHLSNSVPGLVVFPENGRSKPYEFFEFVEELDQEQPHHCNAAFSFRSPYNVRIHSSVNGLIFMHGLIIYNPITSEYITLPPPPDSFSNTATFESEFGFGVSKISNQYKVVRVSRSYGDDSAAPKCSVYTLGTGSWRSISGCPTTSKYVLYEASAFVNGNLHWLAFDSEGVDEGRICCFDLETELFSTFDSPPGTDHEAGTSLTILESCLCLCDNFIGDNFYDGGIIIWLMKEYGDEKSWLKKVSFKLPGLLFYLPLKVFKDGDILMGGDKDGSELVCYSNKTALVFGESTDVLKKCRGSKNSGCKVIYAPSFLPLKTFAMENVSLCSYADLE